MLGWSDHGLATPTDYGGGLATIFFNNFNLFSLIFFTNYKANLFSRAIMVFHNNSQGILGREMLKWSCDAHMTTFPSILTVLADRMVLL
jgi:hypothetical protein